MPPVEKLQTLAELLDRRLIFVMGKGGVGKTTLSIALAFAAESAGKRVLLAETEESGSIGRLLGEIDLTEKPVSVSGKIWIARIDPKAELEAYTQFHVKSGFVSRRITKSRLFDYLSEATPGLREIMTLGRIWRWERERHKDGRPFYDIIIVDSPATGHALSLLRLPKILIDMIRVGPIVSQVSDLQKLLRDEKKTWLTLVCLPEELPVKESLELITIARDEINIPVRFMFLNGVFPSLFNPAEGERLESLLHGKADDLLFSGLPDHQSIGPNLKAAIHQYTRRRIHESYIAQLKDQFPGPVIEVPYLFVNDLTVRGIRQIASRYLRPETGSQETVYAEEHR